MKKKRRLSLIQKRALTGYAFIALWVIGFSLFYVRSIIMNGRFAMSILTMDNVTGRYRLDFCGFDNFVYAFTSHGSFKQTLTTSIGKMLVDVPLITFFSLFMAIMLNKKFPGRGIVRAIFFLPVILNSNAIQAALDLSKTMMNGGLATEVSDTVSTSVIAFDIDYLIDMFMSLGLSAKIITYLAAAVTRINEIISASGVQIIIFIAALQSIQPSMYEVAKIEGATAYETFWKVTFPMVMPHIITNVVYTIVDSFTESEIVELAYSTAFKEFNYGLSSVFSLVSTVITCLILVLIVGLIQKNTFYYN